MGVIPVKDIKMRELDVNGLTIGRFYVDVFSEAINHSDWKYLTEL